MPNPSNIPMGSSEYFQNNSQYQHDVGDVISQLPATTNSRNITVSTGITELIGDDSNGLWLYSGMSWNGTDAYIPHEFRIKSKPDWITGMTIQWGFARHNTMTLYSKGARCYLNLQLDLNLTGSSRTGKLVLIQEKSGKTCSFIVTQESPSAIFELLTPATVTAPAVGTNHTPIIVKIRSVFHLGENNYQRAHVALTPVPFGVTYTSVWVQTNQLGQGDGYWQFSLTVTANNSPNVITRSLKFLMIRGNQIGIQQATVTMTQPAQPFSFSSESDVAYVTLANLNGTSIQFTSTQGESNVGFQIQDTKGFGVAIDPSTQIVTFTPNASVNSMGPSTLYFTQNGSQNQLGILVTQNALTGSEKDFRIGLLGSESTSPLVYNNDTETSLPTTNISVISTLGYGTNKYTQGWGIQNCVNGDWSDVSWNTDTQAGLINITNSQIGSITLSNPDSINGIYRTLTLTAFSSTVTSARLRLIQFVTEEVRYITVNFTVPEP